MNGGKTDEHNLYRVSIAVLRTHEAKRFPGGLIASLSIPWGFSKGDDDLGGYHLAWPRTGYDTGIITKKQASQGGDARCYVHETVLFDAFYTRFLRHS